MGNLDSFYEYVVKKCQRLVQVSIKNNPANIEPRMDQLLSLGTNS